MGKFSRAKGYRCEAGIVNALKAAGVAAERVPLSGGAGGQFSGDIAIGPRRYESKVRADGFKQLYAALADHDGLFVKADRNARDHRRWSPFSSKAVTRFHRRRPPIFMKVVTSKSSQHGTRGD
jgi:hypothetical protein